MPSIGSFTVAKKVISGELSGEPAEPTTFDFEGETFTVIDYEPSALPMMELSDAIQSGVEEDSTPALAAMYQMLQHCIAESDWPRFRRTAMASRATVDDVMPIVSAVWEAVTGRPTGRPSASADGPSTTGPNSKGASPSPTARPYRYSADLPPEPAPVTPRLSAVPSRYGWDPPPGRPDLDVELTPVEELIRAG